MATYGASGHPFFTPLAFAEHRSAAGIESHAPTDGQRYWRYVAEHVMAISGDGLGTPDSPLLLTRDAELTACLRPLGAFTTHCAELVYPNASPYDGDRNAGLSSPNWRTPMTTRDASRTGTFSSYPRQEPTNAFAFLSSPSRTLQCCARSLRRGCQTPCAAGCRHSHWNRLRQRAVVRAYQLACAVWQ
jgi:hypothetical protein